MFAEGLICEKLATSNSEYLNESDSKGAIKIDLFKIQKYAVIAISYSNWCKSFVRLGTYFISFPGNTFLSMAF